MAVSNELKSQQKEDKKTQIKWFFESDVGICITILYYKNIFVTPIDKFRASVAFPNSLDGIHDFSRV